MKGRIYFTSQLFKFFEDLKANNKREWFQANKQRYETAVRAPALQFISDFAPYLRKINKHYVADPKPNGGSLMRIYRDIRFSPNKSPYKTNLGAHFVHERPTEGSAPGFYLHLDAEHCFAGGGLWHPDPRTLNKVRSAILNRSSDWKKLKASGIKIQGDSLKRPPRGYSVDHPLIEDLMLKDFTSGTTFSRKQVQSNEFLGLYVDACKKMSPFMAFLTKAVGLPW